MSPRHASPPLCAKSLTFNAMVETDSDVRAAEPVAPELARARATYRLAETGVVALLVLGCAIPLSLNLVDPDLWGHVRYGQDWLAEGNLPRTATHTYTAEGYPWINHENVAELLFAVGFAYLPVHVMLVLKCLLGLCLLACMAWTASWHGVSRVASWTLLFVVAANLQAFFPMRPQLLSFACLTVALVLLDRGFVGWQESRRVDFRWLVGLIPLMAVWANSHGAFVAGLCIVGALLAGRMVELAVDRGVSGWKLQVKLAGVGIGCVVSTLANPYGWELHRWLLRSLGSPRPEITEWAPPTPDTPVFWPLVCLLAVTLISWVGSRERRDWPQMVVFGLVAWQACEHLRHISLVAVLAGFWVPVHFASAARRLLPEGGTLPVVSPPRWLQACMACGVMAGVVLESLTLAHNLSDFPVHRDHYPVDALQYMVDHRLEGKLVVSFNWAQYALSALAPHVRVGFDGRFRTCYPQEVVDMHFDFLVGEHQGRRFRSANSGPIDPRKVLQFGSPDLVLVDRRYGHATGVMQGEATADAPAWTLLYRDPVAELWGRASQYDEPTSARYLPPEDRALDVKLLMARFQWPALPDYSLWEELEAQEGADRRSLPADAPDAGQTAWNRN
jgi:hypothetical protein